MSSLVSAYDSLTTGPYEAVYVRAAGWVSTEPLDGFAADYSESWRLTRLDEIRAIAPGDCDDVDRPTWLAPDTGMCESPRTKDITDCLTSELVTADLALQDVVTKAQSRAGSTPELYYIQRHWEAYREAQCMEAHALADGGTLGLPSMLGCRLRLALERKKFVAALYLGEDDSWAQPSNKR